MKAVFVQVRGGHHDPFRRLQYVGVVGEALEQQAALIVGIPFEAALQALLLPLGELGLEPGEQYQGDRHGQGQGEPSGCPLVAWLAEEDEGQRGGDEDAYGVTCPPVPPGIRPLDKGNGTRQKQGCGAEAGADQAARGPGQEQESQCGRGAVEPFGKPSPASCQRTAGEGLKNGSDGDHQRREPGPAFKSGPRHGFDVGQESADEDGWPDALPEDQDGGKGNAGRWIEWRDVAGGNGHVQGQQSGYCIGAADDGELFQVGRLAHAALRSRLWEWLLVTPASGRVSPHRGSRGRCSIRQLPTINGPRVRGFSRGWRFVGVPWASPRRPSFLPSAELSLGVSGDALTAGFTRLLLLRCGSISVPHGTSRLNGRMLRCGIRNRGSG